jgi:anti-sigma B factor antagonist
MLPRDSSDDPTTGDRTLASVKDGHGFEARVLEPECGTDGVIVVTVAGEVDMATAGLLWQALEDACDRAGSAGCVVVDMADTTFIDSSGLAVLIRTHKRLDHRPGSVIIRRTAETIRQVLKISAVDEFIPVIDELP